MTPAIQDVFADTVFWVGLVVKQDQHHQLSQRLAQQITGRITTTSVVLLEAANTLSRPAWRSTVIALIDHLQQRSDVEIVPLSDDLWRRGWELYRNRRDKAWSLTDCVSFLVMQDAVLSDALTADEHFRQAGFRALMLEP